MSERKNEPMEGTLLSTVECAELKGVTPQAIVAAIKRGALIARKVGPTYVIRSEDCAAYVPAFSSAEKGARSKGTPKTIRPQGKNTPEEQGN
jgi:hypothetical protein